MIELKAYILGVVFPWLLKNFLEGSDDEVLHSFKRDSLVNETSQLPTMLLLS